MKKKTYMIFSALVLAAVLVLAGCGGSPSEGSKPSGEGKRASTSAEKETAVSEVSISSESSEAASATEDAPGGFGPDTPYSAAFATYLDILQAHKAEILNYNWQCGYEDPAEKYNKPVAVVNILGDEIPELLFVRADPAPEGESPVPVSSLHVFTYMDGRAVCLYSAMWDVQVGGGLQYALLLPSDDDMSRTCFYISQGDERWTESWEYFGLGDSDILVPYGSFEQISFPEENGSLTYNFLVDENTASLSEFNSQKNELMKSIGKVLLFNNPSSQTEEIKNLIDTKEVCEMSYEEAVAFLKGGMKEGEKASEVLDAYGYILPDSDTRIYTAEDLAHLTDDELAQARNEIFARHGRIFSDTGWAIRFGVFTWYEPLYPADTFDEGSLNDTEKKNLETILGVEAARNGGGSTGGETASGGENSGEGSGSGENVRPDNGMIMHTYYLDDYTFVLPTEWWSKVTVVRKFDVIYIYSLEPEGYPVVEISPVPASTPYESGDPLYHCVWHKDSSTGYRIEAWAYSYPFIFHSEINNPAACPDEYKTMKDVDEQKLLDLQTGGKQDLYDLRNGSFTYDSNYFENLLDQAITPK